jgi:hypothetical protein
MTFMHVVDEYFKGKRVANPKRVLPWRSMIRDNVDEYVTDGDGGIGSGIAPFDMDYVRYIEEQQQKSKTISETYGFIQTSLRAIGVDPIQVGVDKIAHPLGKSHATAPVQSQSGTKISSWGEPLRPRGR